MSHFGSFYFFDIEAKIGKINSMVMEGWRDNPWRAREDFMPEMVWHHLQGLVGEMRKWQRPENFLHLHAAEEENPVQHWGAALISPRPSVEGDVRRPMPAVPAQAVMSVDQQVVRTGKTFTPLLLDGAEVRQVPKKRAYNGRATRPYKKRAGKPRSPYCPRNSVSTSKRVTAAKDLLTFRKKGEIVAAEDNLLEMAESPVPYEYLGPVSMPINYVRRY